MILDVSSSIKSLVFLNNNNKRTSLIKKIRYVSRNQLLDIFGNSVLSGVPVYILRALARAVGRRNCISIPMKFCTLDSKNRTLVAYRREEKEKENEHRSPRGQFRSAPDRRDFRTDARRPT